MSKSQSGASTSHCTSLPAPLSLLLVLNNACVVTYHKQEDKEEHLPPRKYCSTSFFTSEMKKDSTLLLHILIYSNQKYKNKVTVCSRVLLEELTVIQLVYNVPTFYRTQRFTTLFTRPGKLCYPEQEGFSSHPHTQFL